MTREELQKRIDNKNKDIEKINKRITKWATGLRPQDIEICKPFSDKESYAEAYKNFKAYLEINKDQIPSSEDWNKGPDIRELKNAYIDLSEANATLEKYVIQLEKITNFENQEKIKAIWDFLCEWETKCYNWYLENAKLYLTLKQGYKQAKANWKQAYLDKNPEPSHEIISDWRRWKRDYQTGEKYFIEGYFQRVHALTIELTTLVGHYEDSSINSDYVYDSYKVNTEKLTQILKEEKNRKYEDLVKRVTAVTGTIKDASKLSIGKQQGEINGIVIGERSKAKVETISAGGYNIQCFHYRVLVHEIKD